MIHGMVKSGVFFLLKNVANALHATNNLQIIPDFSLKDSRDQTVLGLALWTGKAVRQWVGVRGREVEGLELMVCVD